MSSTDKILIRIQADITDLNSKIDTVLGKLQGFQHEVKNTDTVTQQLNVGLRAFSWGTFIGGVLNASTAITQLVTSTSNLNRAQYIVRQATVSVERAEDQLARKTLQLTKELEKNGRFSEKAALIRNEIATATEQLANKEERLKLAVDQVSDTYALFGSNVVNTVFGVIQTLIGLKTMVAQRTIATKLALDQERISYDLNTRSALANVAATSAVANSRLGLASGIPPLTGAFAGATHAVSNLTGVLGKAGLIGAIAAVGIGLGAFVFDQIKANDQLQKSIEKSDNLTKSVNELAKSFDSTASIVDVYRKNLGSFGSFVDNLQTDIDDLIKKIKELQTEQEELSKTSPNLFGLNKADQAKKFAENIEAQEQAKAVMLGKKAQQFQAKQTWEDVVGSFVDKGISKTLEQFKINRDYKNISVGVGIMDTLEKLQGEIEEYGKKTKLSFADATVAYGEHIDFMVDGNKLLEVDFVRMMGVFVEYNKHQKHTNDLAKENNKINQENIKLMKQMAEQKKSLLAQFGYLQPGRNLRKFISGETNYFTGEDGYPFSGVINKKTNTFVHEGNILQAWEQVKGIMEAAGRAYKINIEHGLDPFPAIRWAENEVKKIKNEINFVASDSNIRKFAQPYSNAISQIQDSFRKDVEKGQRKFPIFGGASKDSKEYTKQIEKRLSDISKKAGYETPGEHFRTGVLGDPKLGDALRKKASADRARSAELASRLSRGLGSKMPGAKVGGLRRSKGRGGRGRGAKSGAEERIEIAAQLAAQLAGEVAYLNVIDEALEDFALPTGLFPGVPSSRFELAPYGNRISPETFRRLDAAADIAFKADVAFFRQQMSTVRERSGLLGYTSSLGMNLGTIYNTITNPETANDIDDMLRYNARLAQISTGATVI